MWLTAGSTIQTHFKFMCDTTSVEALGKGAISIYRVNLKRFSAPFPPAHLLCALLLKPPHTLLPPSWHTSRSPEQVLEEVIVQSDNLNSHYLFVHNGRYLAGYRYLKMLQQTSIHVTKLTWIKCSTATNFVKAFIKLHNSNFCLFFEHFEQS